MFCPKCNKEIADGSSFCPECGERTLVTNNSTNDLHNSAAGTRDQNNTSKLVHPKNPPLTPHLCWINLLLSGLAQMIYGQIAKGIFLLAITIISNLFLPIILALVIGGISIVDAYMVGKALKNGAHLTKWAWFPKS